MFDSCVLGVDPGLAATGLAAVARRDGKPEVLWSATLRTAPGLAEAQRLRLLHDSVGQAIATHGATYVAVERVMWGRNVGSAMSVARATGVVLLAASQAGVPVEEYAPLEVKMAVTGVGNAQKTLVRESLERIHRLSGVPSEQNAVDAVAVAFCHLQQERLRRAARA